MPSPGNISSSGSGWLPPMPRIWALSTAIRWSFPPSECSGQVAVKVTERLKPGVLFLPTHYGGTSPYLTRAQGFGLNMMVSFRCIGPGVGSTMSQEVAVKVRKVEG